jgi:hypothetical protein
MTSEEVVFTSEYVRLVRFLEPALLIVEDVDVIAQGSRDASQHAVERDGRPARGR